jgi:hypothetical protein
MNLNNPVLYIVFERIKPERWLEVLFLTQQNDYTEEQIIAELMAGHTKEELFEIRRNIPNELFDDFKRLILLRDNYCKRATPVYPYVLSKDPLNVFNSEFVAPPDKKE